MTYSCESSGLLLVDPYNDFLSEGAGNTPALTSWVPAAPRCSLQAVGVGNGILISSRWNKT
jgi:hypothetical protein